MDSKVRAFIRKKQLIKENTTVLIGVSGGPDSVALLHFFQRMKTEWQLTVIAVSVDHQLRGSESLADLDYVRDLCDQWGIRFIGASLDVKAYKKAWQVGTQVAAREIRYNFFEEQMNRFNADYLALGHHGDDQTETMVMRLTRAASTKSLAGIPVQRKFASGKIIRPLLCVTKKEIENYCLDMGMTPRRDPSNDDNTYTRNYYRNKVMPLLKEKNSNLHTTIQHLSESIQEDEAFLRAEAAKRIDNVVTFHDSEAEVTFNIPAFKTNPLSLQRRFFHLILNYLYNHFPKKLSYIHEEQFLMMLNEEYGHVQIDFPQNLKLKRTYQDMHFYFLDEPSQQFFYHMIMELPGVTVLPDGMTVTADYTNYPDIQGEATYICHEQDVALPLHIRTRQPGDRLSWKGLNGSKKVKDIFIDAKIPLNERDTWPIITDNNGELLWLIGLRKGLTPGEIQSEGNYIQLSYENSNL